VTSLRFRTRAAEGSALVVSFAILLTVLIFSAATFQAASVLTNRSNTESDAQQAFQAADAGIDAAIHRISQLSAPSSTQLLTTDKCVKTSGGAIVAALPDNGVWCTTTASETVGSRGSFTYAVSTSPSPACAGSTAPGDRCVVATGTVNGTQRRLQVRVATTGSSSDAVFSKGAVNANDSIKVESGVSISYSGTSSSLLGMQLNTKLEVSHGSTIGVPIKIGRYAKTPKGIAAGSYTRAVLTSEGGTDPDPLVQSAAPQFGETAYHVDASHPGGNNNLRISSTYYNAGTGTPPNTRKLTVPNNKQVTLIPGTYNFCTIDLAGRGIINTAGTAASPVKIYLDSPYRENSACPKNTGTIKSGGKAAFVNPSLDPTALQIYAWGSTSRKKKSNLQIPMGKNGTLAAIIYAPNSEVRFADSKGILIGGITGRRIVFKKNMRFISDSRVTTWGANTIRQTARLAWKQCDSTILNPSSPSQGC
jgi:hypothetical protein